MESDRRHKLHYILLAAFLIVAALLRGWFMAEIKSAPDFRQLRQDMSVQDYQARAMLSGDWTPPEGRSDPEIASTPYYRPPGYCYLLAGIYYLSGGSYLAPRLFNVVLGLMAIALMYQLSLLLWNRRTALITVFLMATYWGFIFYEGEVNDPAIFVFLIPCLLLALYKWQQSFQVRWILLTGMITGCYALMRPNILLFGPFMAAWILWTGFKKTTYPRIAAAWIVLALSTFLIITPVTIRNYVVSGEFVPVSTYFGENLYIGNCDDADGYTSWTPYLQELIGTGEFSVWEYAKIVQGLGRAVGKPDLTHSEASTIFARMAVDWIREKPVEAARITLKKAVLFWSPKEITENKVVHYEKAWYGPLKFLPGFPYVLTLFLLGLAILTGDSFQQLRKKEASEESDCKNIPLLVLVLSFIVIYWFSFLPFFVNARARHPIVGLLFLIAAYGLQRFFQTARKGAWKKTVALVVITVLLFAAAHWEPYPYTPDKARWHYARAESWLWDGQVEPAVEEAALLMAEDYSYYMPYRIGHAMAKKQRHDVAEYLLQGALSPDPEEQPRPYRQDLYFHIGAAQAAQGKNEEAAESFQQALTLNPADARAHNDLGVLLEKEDRLLEALAAYEKAVECNPDFALAQSNRGHLLGLFHRHHEAIEAFQIAADLAPENPEHLYNLAIHHVAAQQPEAARKAYEQTLQLAPKHPRALNNLALLDVAEGKEEAAFEKLRQAITIDPAFLLPRANLGNLLIDAGRYEEGLEVYEETLRLFPEHVELYNKIGLYTAKHGDLHRAEAFYSRALALDPENKTAQHNLAALRLGNTVDEEKDEETSAPDS
ncbi:MAG: tetratricopeptide repeat protein [Candidatus Hydrogenedens sp.]|nr:tetratricopeptide repeat protein [Candidatus Hydrogenedens sp.]